MTNVSELVNSQREITLGDTTLKVRQLKVKELFVYFENKAIESKINGAKQISETLGGEDKITFMMKVWDNLPKGEALTDLATEAMTTLDGVCDMFYMAAKDLNTDLSEDDIKGLIQLDTIEALGGIVAWISGLDEVAEADEASEEGDKKK